MAVAAAGMVMAEVPAATTDVGRAAAAPNFATIETIVVIEGIAAIATGIVTAARACPVSTTPAATSQDVI